MVAPTAMVMIWPLSRVMTKSVSSGALSTVALMVMSAPSLTAAAVKVRVLLSMVSFTVTVAVSVVTRFSNSAPPV